MTEEERLKLVNFCVKATAYLHDVHENVIDRSEFAAMSDEQLEQEANWLDDMLDK